MTVQRHFYAIPVTLLYRWLKSAGPVNLCKFAAAVPPGMVGRKIEAAAALKVIRACPSAPASFHCNLPVALYNRLKAALPSPLGKSGGELLRSRLLYFTGAVRPSYLKQGSYKGLRTFVKFDMTNHEVVAIKVLSRALNMSERQLVALLLDGAVVERHVILKQGVRVDDGN